MMSGYSDLREHSIPSESGLIFPVRYRASANDGGGGLFIWDASSTATDDDGTIIAITGQSTGRWHRLYEGNANVKWWGATGDGTTDDTTAIQAAVDAVLPLSVPRGGYKLSSAITWDPMTRPLIMVGESALNIDPSDGQSKFLGTAALGEEPMFHRVGRYMKADGTYYNTISEDPALTIGEGIFIQNIQFYVSQTNDVGTAFEVQGCEKSFIENCYFFAGLRGLTLGQSNFDTTVINCTFAVYFNNSVNYTWPDDAATALKAWGLYASGHKFLVGIAAIGAGTGIYLVGAGNSLYGARLETNCYGLVLGDTEYNVTGIGAGSVSRSFISGVSYEANAIGVYVASGDYTTLSGIAGQGSPTDGYRADSEIGIHVAAAGTAFNMQNCGAGGTFTKGDIINDTNVPLLFSDGLVSGGAGGNLPGAWNALSKFTTIPTYYTFIRTPVFGDAVNQRHKTMTAFHDLMLPGLTGLNIKDQATSGDAQGGPIFAKNLGGTVAPSNGATTAAVAFYPSSDIASSNVAFASITPSSGGSLAADTYYYATTLIGPHAETGIDYADATVHAHRTVTVTANQQVAFTFYGGGAGYKRRIYRGTAIGVFDGYWEIAGDATFTDTGAIAFDGAGGRPPSAASIPSRVEEDANYQIVATPSWGTTAYVTSKATTGFTLNFGTAAPDANQTVAWLMFRP